MSDLANPSRRHPAVSIAWSRPTTVIGLVTAVMVLWVVIPHAIYIRSHTQDIFGLLDGMHRMVQGQVPHRDFSTIIGIFYYGIPALFERAGADPIASINYATATLLIFNCLILLHLLTTRLHGPLAVVFGVWSVLALTARMNFGEDPQFVSLAMAYNRYCAVFLCELLVLFIPPALPSRRVAVLDSLVITAILLVLFYTKITFGLCGIAAAGLLMIFRFREIPVVLTALLMLAIVAASLELTLHFHHAMAEDVLMAIKAAGSKGGRQWQLGNQIVLNLPELVACVGIPALILIYNKLMTVRLMLLFCFVAAISMVLLNNSAQLRIYTMPFALLFVTLDLLQKREAREPRQNQGGIFTIQQQAVWAITLSVGLLYSYPLVANIVVASAKLYTSPIANLGTTLHGKLHVEDRGPDAHEEVQAGPDGLSAFDLLGRGIDNALANQPDRLGGRMYMTSVSDGVSTVQAACGPNATVLTADFVNPFPALLDLPDGGGMVFIHAGVLISPGLYIAPEKLFEGIDCLMVPKLPAMPPTLTFFKATYGGYVAAHFKVIRQTEYWTVLRLNT